MAKPFDLFAMAEQNRVGTCLDAVALEQAGIATGQLWQPTSSDIAVFMTGPDHKYYRVYHDQSISDDMLTAVDDWWTKHVIKGIEPDPDGTDAYEKHLRDRVKQSTEVIKKSTEGIDAAIQTYYSTGAMISKLEKKYKKAKQEIIKYIDEDKGVESLLGTITFNTEHRSNLNKEMLFNNMLEHLPREIVTGILEKSKKPVEIRRLRKKMLAEPDTSTKTITDYLK
jgi:predicted phage-related endonuclease